RLLAASPLGIPSMHTQYACVKGQIRAGFRAGHSDGVTVLARLREGATDVRDSTAMQRLARVGLVARGAFYLLIAYLAARVAALHGSARQADTHGALALIEVSWVGKVVIALAALGLFAFGIARLVGGWLDRDAEWWRRATTMLQGAFYLALAYVPVSFLVGDKQTGSEHAQ